MVLRFVNPHLSITPFVDVELTPLTVITGVNGSGKSHLLSAILARNVVFTELNNPSIVSFNYEDFRLENEEIFNSQNIIAEKIGAWTYFENQVKPHFVNFRSLLQSMDLEHIDQAKQDFTPIWKLKPSSSMINYRSNIENLLSNQQFGNQIINQGILKLARSSNVTLDLITRDAFLDLYNQFERKGDFLPKALGKIFWDYHYKSEKNNYSIYKKQQNQSYNEFYSNEEFKAKFGEPPWLLVNRIISEVNGLNYEVMSPEKFGIYDDFRLQLVSKDNVNLKIDFNNLSSGERVLMALVASIYSNIDASRPPIILLDELDASLHPSMIRSLVRVLLDEFVQKGTRVLKVFAGNNTFPFFLPKNPHNKIAEKGIENLFSEDLMIDMTITTLNPDGSIRSRVFSKDYEMRFEERVIQKASISDYRMFYPLGEIIKDLQHQEEQGRTVSESTTKNAQ